MTNGVERVDRETRKIAVNPTIRSRKTSTCVCRSTPEKDLEEFDEAIEVTKPTNFIK